MAGSSNATPIKYSQQNLRKPACGFHSRLELVRRVVGFRFLVYMIFYRGIVGGVVMDLAMMAHRFMWMDYGLNPSETALTVSIGLMAPLFQPFVGLASDMFPICGYCRWPYLVVFSVIGAVSLAILGAGNTETLSKATAITCVFGVHLFQDWCVAISDSHVVQAIDGMKEVGGDLVLIKQAGKAVLGLLGGLFPIFLPFKVGNDFSNTHKIYCVLCGLAVISVGLSASNVAGEVRQTREMKRMVQASFNRQWTVYVTTGTVAVLSVVPTVISILCPKGENGEKPYAVLAILSGVCALLCFVTVFLTIRRDIAGLALASFLLPLVNISLENAEGYFNLDNFFQFPTGPHLTSSLFGQLNLVGVILLFPVFFLYGRYSRSFSTSSILQMLVCIMILQSAAQSFYYSRVSARVGISDTIMVMITTVTTGMTTQLLWIPLTHYAGMVSPRGMAGTVWTLVCTCFFSGIVTNQFVSGWYLEFLGIGPTGILGNETKQFENMWVVGVTSCVLCVLLLCVIPLIVQEADPLGCGRSVVYGTIVAAWCNLETRSPIPWSPSGTNPLMTPHEREPSEEPST